MEELISTNVLLNKQIKSLGSQIQFLIRQMDWMNKKLQSDSTHIIDTLRDKGQGYILPPRKLFKLPKMHLPNLNFAFNKA